MTLYIRKLKLDTYEVLNRAYTPKGSIYISSFDDLHKVGRQLLETAMHARYQAFDSGAGVAGCNGVRDLRLRLMGLKASNLRDEREHKKSAEAPSSLHQVSRSIYCRKHLIK